jgi:hypothetical protein
VSASASPTIPVITIATNQAIAAAANQGIAASTTIKLVITSAAIQRVSSSAARKNIGLPITQQTIGSGTTLDILNTRQRIKPGRAGGTIADKAYRDRTGLGEIIGEISAKPTNQTVIAIATGKMVITSAAIQSVGISFTNHPVTTIAAN